MLNVMTKDLEKDNDVPDISDIIAYFIEKGNFYAHMLHRLPYEVDTKLPSIMGVTWENKGYKLLYNPERMKKVMAFPTEYRLKFLSAVIAHEAMHVILNQIPRIARMYNSLPETKKAALMTPLPALGGVNAANIALDAADNDNIKGEFSVIANHHKDDKKWGWILPNTIGASDNATLEQYADMLLEKFNFTDPDKLLEKIKDMIKKKKKQKGDGDDGEKGDQKTKGKGNKPGEGQGDQPGEGEGQGDQPGDGDGEGQELSHRGAHNDWDKKLADMSISELEELAQSLEAESQSLIDQASKTYGSVPGQVQAILTEMFAKGEVPWYRLLRNMIVNKIASKKIRSLRRSKRRAATGSCIYPGHVKDFSFRIKFGIDNSGSMSSEDISNMLNELKSIVNTFPGVEVEVVEYDAEIQRIYQVNKKKDIIYEERGRGGTSFDPFFKYVQECKGGCEFAINGTDGYAPSPTFRPNVPVIWVITAGGENPCPEYGKEIKLTK